MNKKIITLVAAICWAATSIAFANDPVPSPGISTNPGDITIVNTGQTVESLTLACYQNPRQIGYQFNYGDYANAAYYFTGAQLQDPQLSPAPCRANDYTLVWVGFIDIECEGPRYDPQKAIVFQVFVPPEHNCGGTGKCICQGAYVTS